MLPNGNILIADPHHGRLFEIAPAHGGKTVWEWINATETGYAGLVTDVQRVARKDLPWVGSSCDRQDEIAASTLPGVAPGESTRFFTHTRCTVPTLHGEALPLKQANS